ncbi:chloride channel protein [Roseimaritima sediminicola]|uniref:chloride channel protein n=1 Tax=Roseimaritima sediminicola TaxID=2662066 RepID=UPI001F2796E4|nr:chloride channel protein [Roseimaritima sediminicola]
MKFINRIIDALDIRSSGRWFFYSALVGVAAGVGAIAFYLLSQLVIRFALAQFAGYTPPMPAGEQPLFPPAETPLMPWMIVVVMTLGGLVSGTLVYWLAPEADGAGGNTAIDAFHNGRGDIRGRVPLVKMVASAVTLGTGGSGGQEGPIALIGAGIGSWLGARLKLSHRDRRILLAAGMGAGVGAIFRAPLAGAIFAGEILYSDADLEADVIVPAATASIVAYSVFTQALPAETRFLPLFGENLYHSFSSPVELLPYSALAAVLIAGGILYVSSFDLVGRLFGRLPVVRHLRPAIGALLAGLVGIGLWYVFAGDMRALAVLGIGYGTLHETLNAASGLGIPLLLAIALTKILTTSLTIGSGGSGGVFGPSMVIGGCLGAAVGLVFQAAMPALAIEPEAFAVVGMAGFFAGVARAPISTIIMVRALTGDFGLLVPTMLVSTLTFITCNRWKLYRMQVPTRMDSKAHRGDFLVDVLEGLRVRDVCQSAQHTLLIDESMTLDEIVHLLAENQQHYFPVVDRQQNMVGIFTDDDVRSYLYNDAIWRLAVAGDVMTSPFVSVAPEDDLNTALKRFTSLNVDELPVIDPEKPRQLIGMLRRKETIAAYNQRLMEHKQAAADA